MKQGIWGAWIASLVILSACSSSSENSPTGTPPPPAKPASEKLQTDLNPLLGQAAEKGDIAQVKDLLIQGADPNHVELYKESALFRAVKQGHLEIAELLIANRAKIDSLAPNATVTGTLPFWILDEYRNRYESKKFGETVKVGVVPGEIAGTTEQQKLDRDLQVYSRFLDLGSTMTFERRGVALFDLAIEIDTRLARDGYSSAFAKAMADRGFQLEQLRSGKSALAEMVNGEGSSLLVDVVLKNFGRFQNHFVTLSSGTEPKKRVRQNPSQDRTLTDQELSSLIQLLQILHQVGADFNGMKDYRPPLFTAIYNLSPDVFERVYSTLHAYNWSFLGNQGSYGKGSTPLLELSLWLENPCQLTSSRGGGDLIGGLYDSVFGRKEGDCLNDMLDNIETYFRIAYRDYSDTTAQQLIKSLVNFQGESREKALNYALFRPEFSPRLVDFLVTLGADMDVWLSGKEGGHAPEVRAQRLAKLKATIPGFEELLKSFEFRYHLRSALDAYKKRYDSMLEPRFEKF